MSTPDDPVATRGGADSSAVLPAASRPDAAAAARAAAHRLSSLLLYALTDDSLRGEALRRRAYPQAAAAAIPRAVGAPVPAPRRPRTSPCGTRRSSPGAAA